MRIKYLLIFVWFSLLSQISAQPKTFHLSFKLEFYSYTLQKGYSPEIYFSPLPSFHVLLVKDLSESFSINLTPGIIFRPYQAFELGFCFNNKFPASAISLSGGLNLNFIEGDASNSGNSESKTIFFLVIGAGHQITNRLLADISFHQALNGKYGRFELGPKRIYNMLKIGLAVVL